jgi:hypothetical protein
MCFDLNYCLTLFTGCAQLGLILWSLLGIIVYRIADLGG